MIPCEQAGQPGLGVKCLPGNQEAGGSNPIAALEVGTTNGYWESPQHTYVSQWSSGQQWKNSES